MAFLDELTLHIKAGNGGHGVERWLHEKGKEWGGPSGGNGGKGGDVYVRAVRDIGVLFRYKTTKSFSAEDGGDGMRDSMHGKNGKDITIDFPIGSVFKRYTTGQTFELIKDGEIVKILSGGRGGLGNEHFKSSTNTSPTETTDGRVGEEDDFYIELRLAADIGLAGFPNAGKSSLLNELTNAKAKVGSYAFTTLEPNLGALPGNIVIADIPGLIEGASEGKGLGHAFLKHVKRTKIIAHCISLEDEKLLGNYDTIREELEKYSPELAEKKEIVILTKTDVGDKKKIDAAIKKLKTRNKKVYAVSILDDKAIKKLREEMVKLAQ